jgi:hypothetical protein
LQRQFDDSWCDIGECAWRTAMDHVGIIAMDIRLKSAAMAVFAALSLTFSGPLMAQVQSVDPNDVIDSDLDRPAAPSAPAPGPEWSTEGLATDEQTTQAPPPAAPATTTVGGTVPTPSASTSASGQTFQRDDLIGAAEGVFGQGAEGLGRIIENILREQGEPNGYIVGREVGGAFVFGLRYGSGTLHHRVEGTMPTYWTGPSLGIDAGANAGSTFVLVYNLHDSADLYHRFPAGEGAAYLVGGFNASYMRRGDVVLIPIRLGLGARLGVNVGYMKFSKRQRWLPF